MKAISDRSRGLTLLETVLAISMLAMILVALHTVLSSGVRAYRRCRDSSDRDTMAYSAIGLISDDLLRLTVQAPDQAAPMLLGTPAVHAAQGCMLRLRTHARPAPGARAMLVDYFFMPTEADGGSLLRRSEPLVTPGSVRHEPPADGGSDDQLARYEVVAAGIRSLRLRYFDGRNWSRRWNSAEHSSPPRLVEVTLEFSGRDGGQTAYTQALPVAVERPLITAAAKEGRL